MDANAVFRDDPARVVFRIGRHGHGVTARVGLAALTRMAGAEVDEGAALMVYRDHWQELHRAAVTQLEEGVDAPFIRD